MSSYLDPGILPTFLPVHQLLVILQRPPHDMRTHDQRGHAQPGLVTLLQEAAQIRHPLAFLKRKSNINIK